MAINKLLFVDTNILLDFYRARTEAGLSLLRHVNQINEKLITTYLLEIEFKKNRHAAIAEGIKELKVSWSMQRPGIFSDAKAVRAIEANLKSAQKRVKTLQARYMKAIRNPPQHDPVYQVAQRLFRKESEISLHRGNLLERPIKRLAMQRFFLGCPPRKRGDTSIGDSFNWEWMVHCAEVQRAELVIVSRDSDFGAVFDDVAYINDHLKQEFSERISKKRKIVLFHKLSHALDLFKIKVTDAERAEETAIAGSRAIIPGTGTIELAGLDPLLQ